MPKVHASTLCHSPVVLSHLKCRHTPPLAAAADVCFQLEAEVGLGLGGLLELLNHVVAVSLRKLRLPRSMGQFWLWSDHAGHAGTCTTR